MRVLRELRPAGGGQAGGRPRLLCTADTAHLARAACTACIAHPSRSLDRWGPGLPHPPQCRSWLPPMCTCPPPRSSWCAPCLQQARESGVAARSAQQNGAACGHCLLLAPPAARLRGAAGGGQAQTQTVCLGPPIPLPLPPHPAQSRPSHSNRVLTVSSHAAAHLCPCGSGGGRAAGPAWCGCPRCEGSCPAGACRGPPRLSHRRPGWEQQQQQQQGPGRRLQDRGGGDTGGVGWRQWAALACS